MRWKSLIKSRKRKSRRLKVRSSSASVWREANEQHAALLENALQHEIVDHLRTLSTCSSARICEER